MRVHYILYYIAALFCVACASESSIQEVTPIAPVGDDPIRFTGAAEAAATRSAMPSNLLRSDFVVSTFKNYDNPDAVSSENTVMPRYLVQYKENRDDWNGVVVSNWNYIGIPNPWETNQEQKERYWDLSAFPYRFHAVAPAHGNTITTYHIQTLGSEELFINAPYKAQTFTAPIIADGASSESPSPSITPAASVAEPYLLAQVSRDANGNDLDLIKMVCNPNEAAINTESNSKNRRVWLPFHHLNSKVRFAIYTDNLAQTDRVDYIKDLTIWAEHLATSASGYKAYGTAPWATTSGFSYFYDINVQENVKLFEYNCFDAAAPSSVRSYEQNNLSLHQSKSSAYFFECPDGIMQLPQNNVKLHVTMKVVGKDGTESAQFYDYEITKDANSDADPTHWQAGCIHTYYIHLQFQELKLPIMTVTCTLTPWEDVSGGLSTDLEQ